MRCPFCSSINSPTANACQVCGGPLHATKSVIEPEQKLAPVSLAPVSIPVAVPSAPQLLNSLTLDEKLSPIVGVGACLVDAPVVGLLLKNGDLRLWNPSEDTLVALSNRRWFGQPKRASCASFAPQPGLMASGHECGQVRWFEFDGRELNSPPAHVGRVVALAFASAHLYSGGSDGVIWATPLPGDGKAKARVLIEGLGAMTTMTFSPDGTLLAVGRDDGAVQGWRFNADDDASDDGVAVRLDWTRNGHDAPICSLGFSPNGAMLVSRDANHNLCLWAAQTSYQLPLAPHARQSRVAPMFSADNRSLCIANDESVEAFDIALETPLYQLPPSGETVRHLAFVTDEDAQQIVVAGERQVAVWEIG